MLMAERLVDLLKCEQKERWAEAMRPLTLETSQMNEAINLLQLIFLLSK